MIVILISGKIGAGKTTFSHLLEKELNHRGDIVAMQLKLSKPMKDIAAKMGWNGEKDARGRKLLTRHRNYKAGSMIRLFGLI